MSTTFFKCRGYELAVIILYKKHFHIYVTCIIQYIKALIDIFMDKYICGHINTPTFFITLINSRVVLSCLLFFSFLLKALILDNKQNRTPIFLRLSNSY